MTHAPEGAGRCSAVTMSLYNFPGLAKRSPEFITKIQVIGMKPPKSEKDDSIGCYVPWCQQKMGWT
jgi:hypothetical protein